MKINIFFVAEFRRILDKRSPRKAERVRVVRRLLKMSLLSLLRSMTKKVVTFSGEKKSQHHHLHHRMSPTLVMPPSWLTPLRLHRKQAK